MIARLFFAVAFAAGTPVAALATTPVSLSTHRANADLTGRVVDSLYGKPLAGAEILVRNGTTVVSRVTADQFGSWRVHDLTPASYDVEARLIGFLPQHRTVVVGATGGTMTVDFKLAPSVVQLERDRSHGVASSAQYAHGGPSFQGE